MGTALHSTLCSSAAAEEDDVAGQRDAGGGHHRGHVHDPRLHPPLLCQERVVRHPPLQPHGQHTASTDTRRDISLLVLYSAPSVPQPVFTIMEKDPTRGTGGCKTLC